MSAREFGARAEVLAFKAFWFFVGGTLFHSAFCVYNDIVDRDLDSKVGKSPCVLVIMGLAR